MNPFIAVIADDLTGVCDTGAQFASAGLRTVGSVTQEFKSKTVPRVLLVNTQSRSLEGPEASQLIQQTATELKRFEPKWFFKKIDTALRGNIAVEVLSMMEALEVCTVLHAASIPGAGRTTVRGCQFFRGIPIKESIHGEDRLNPNLISTSSNIELFSKTPKLKIESITLDEVRSGNLNISDRRRDESRTILIFDSETDDDLDTIVRASMKMDPSSFFYVGSFGLSSALGRYLADSLRIAKIPNKTLNRQTVPFRKKRILVVSGSSHPMARAQISYLEKKGIAEIVRFEPEDLMEHLEACITEAGKTFQAAVDRRNTLVLSIGEGRSGIRRQSQELVIALAKVVHSLLESDEVDGLVLIGGETGYGVCRAAGIERIEILGNISFVAAYGRPEGSFPKIKFLATKGGSLGEEDILEKILNFVDTQAYQ
jgi:D-threonate/D-erythronate kinase